MTQVAFSHQFSQRWIDTPVEIKNALLQRLDDIIRLLDEETDLDRFEFSIANLDAYLDDLYAQMAANTAKKPIQQALVQKETEHSDAEQSKVDQIETFDVDVDIDKDEVDELNVSKISAPPAFAFEHTDGNLDTEFIKGLERSIDDYLSDQLSRMSEDLKAWLQEAINNRLNKQSEKL